MKREGFTTFSLQDYSAETNPVPMVQEFWLFYVLTRFYTKWTRFLSYFHKEKDSSPVVLVVSVDGVFTAGKLDTTLKELKCKLKAIFLVQDLGEVLCIFFGWESDGIEKRNHCVSQGKAYWEGIRQIFKDKCKTVFNASSAISEAFKGKFPRDKEVMGRMQAVLCVLQLV